ncbi:sensor histidine kinase [Rubellicoccus peritrichatus]|uniref:histidine kinase n=1 Tax=Rubellicoccus peritrichatus TaxID=3080537 RepID=A0AAQ3LA54_9BACT|nr:ATP-binding protein [Puniceicoccus sp. CR14]WOO42110.1 PAS domain S-box protein [Puniceicoccus sp. CR14]
MNKLPRRVVISKAKVGLLTALAFVAASFVAVIVDRADERLLDEEAQVELLEQLNQIEAVLENKLKKQTELTAAIAGYIQAQPNLTQREFEALAQNLAVASGGLIGVQLEQDSRISHVYPAWQFERLGDRPVDQLYSIGQDGELSPSTYFGDLLPDRDILLSRTPIRVKLRVPDAEQGAEDTEVLWGYVILVFDIESAIEASGLLAEKYPVAIALTFKPAKRPNEEIIFGDASVLSQKATSVSIGLPDGNWMLSGVDRGWQKILEHHRIRRRAIETVAVVLLSLTTFYFLNYLRSRGLVSDSEYARHESERQFAFLIREAAADPIAVFDREGKILEFNDESAHALGYSREEMSKLTVFDVDCGYTHDELKEGLEKLRPGQISRLRTKHQHKNGNEIPVEVRLGVVETGEGLRIISMVRDISAQKRYEEELENLNRDKDKFFSIIGHDLKGPLSGFLGLTEMLATDSEAFSPSELKMLGAEMNKAGKNLFNLLEDLLDWSRLQMGRIECDPQDFAIQDIVEANISLLSVNSRNKEIDLIADCEPDCAVHADLEMINTVVRNLISNAIKFTERGGSVTVSSIRKGDQIITSVADTGVGMDSKQVESLFVAGRSKRTEGTEKEKGTGFGLLLCYELVVRNGGELHVESKLGEGSVFSFNLPIVEANGETHPVRKKRTPTRPPING